MPESDRLIGNLHGTTQDRSIVIVMERKPRHVSVAPLRKTSPEAWLAIRRKLFRWASDHKEAIRNAQVNAIDSLHDRANDNWFPLLAIAGECGKEWTTKTLDAFKAIDPGEDDDDSIVVALLKTLRKVRRIFRPKSARVRAFFHPPGGSIRFYRVFS